MADVAENEGVVKWFSPKLGYGFIINSAGKQVMVHYKDVPGQEGQRNLQEGDRVKFLQTETENGLKVTQVLEFTRSL